MLSATHDPAWPEGIRLVLVGDGDERGLVESEAINSARIVYLGQRGYRELPAIVAASKGSLICKEGHSPKVASWP